MEEIQITKILSSTPSRPRKITCAKTMQMSNAISEVPTGIPKNFCRMQGGMSMPPVEPPTRTTNPTPRPISKPLPRPAIRSSSRNSVSTASRSNTAKISGYNTVDSRLVAANFLPKKIHPIKNSTAFTAAEIKDSRTLGKKF